MYNKISEIEPFFPEFNKKELERKAIELVKFSSALGASMPDDTAKQIAELVRMMNSYYSNLIEGNRTTPREIEKALAENFSGDPDKKEKELEHVAHIKVQDEIDIFLNENDPDKICTVHFIKWIHKEFYRHLPKEYRIVKRPDGSVTSVIPGELRKEDVKVGMHVPPSYESVEEFLERFFEAYQLNSLEAIDKIIASAASHHRLAWIHPFLDGNGRVSRLFTYAYMNKAGINPKGLWAISRGFARNLKNYYGYLARADEGRQNDFDGRGNLSDRGLGEFCNYFFDTAIDQTGFMSSLFDLENILARIKKYVDFNIDLPAETFGLLKEAFMMGEIKRGDVPKITGLPERTARRILQPLLKKKLLTSDTPKSALKISFPIDAAEYYFPRLFPVE